MKILEEIIRYQNYYNSYIDKPEPLVIDDDDGIRENSRISFA